MKEQLGLKGHLSLAWDRPEFHCLDLGTDMRKLPVKCLTGDHDLPFKVALFRTRLTMNEWCQAGTHLRRLRSCCSSLFFIKIKVFLGGSAEK